MISNKVIEQQLKQVGFNIHGWGRTEVRELQHILLEEEEIYECVNGIYEGGFALLLATDIRVLLVDKKPLNYLTVEDLRFDMINEIDYNHRLIGAYIKISAGETTLKFSSLNQPRLRKLIGHVQQCMAEAKKRQATHPHLEQINQQLQSYLLAQYQQQQKLHEQLENVWQKQGPLTAAELPPKPEPIEPDQELANYLLSQSLLGQPDTPAGLATEEPSPPPIEDEASQFTPGEPTIQPKDRVDELYAEGRREVFTHNGRQLAASLTAAHLKQLSTHALTSALAGVSNYNPLTAEVNPLGVAYSKLPMALRNRKFGRPLFHAHSQEAVSVLPTEA